MEKISDIIIKENLGVQLSGIDLAEIVVSFTNNESTNYRKKPNTDKELALIFRRY